MQRASVAGIIDQLATTGRTNYDKKRIERHQIKAVRLRNFGKRGGEIRAANQLDRRIRPTFVRDAVIGPRCIIDSIFRQVRVQFAQVAPSVAPVVS